ncbi:MAG: DNA recombination protein RmuC [Pseudomonadota bacterium]
MDPTLLLALAGLVAGAAALVAVLAGRGAGELKRLAEGQGELVGRLAQMAEQAAAAQGQTAQRLEAQERALDKALEGRLDEVSRKLGESLEKSAQATAATVTDLRERLVRIDEAQKTISELSKEVVGLQDILSNKQARGAFGEEQLEAIVRDQLPPAHYEFQATLSNRTRVDCLLKLPPPLGPLGIDAKFPREAWEALRNSGPDEAARHAARRAFAQAIMAHVNDIAEKYILSGETAEAALMFVPSEAVYADIYERAAEVADKARRLRVFIVSPTTLWAVLNTMRAILRDARMREQAGLIQKEVATLLTDIGRLAERVGNLEGHFAAAEKDVRDIRTSLDKIVRRGERISEVEPEPGAAPLPLIPDSQ